jgi:hypothetical protein
MRAVDGRMARERVQTRCDADTVESIEQYADDRDISQSEAVRRLLRLGLDAEGYDSPMSLGADNVERLAEREGYVAANMNTTVRLIGGLLVALAILGTAVWVIL